MRKLILAIMIALTFCALAPAQAPGTGAYPFSSLDNRGFDQVNLGNLNTRFSIGIVNRKGRGLPFNYAIQYDGMVWSATTSGSMTTWSPDPTWGFKGQLNGVSFAGFLTNQQTYDYCYNNDGAYGIEFSYYNYIYHDPFGAQHAFNYTSYTDCSGNTTVTGDGATDDSSGYSFNGEDVIASNGVELSPAYSATGQDPSSAVDTNGNQISFNGSGTFTDTTGANALSITGSGPVTFTYPLVRQTSGATTGSASLSYASHLVRTNFQCPNIGEYGTNTLNLVDHITLGDGSTYSFTYEGTPGASDGAVTGRLASITLPTGGTITYQYTGGCSGAGAGINPDGTVGSLTRTTTDGTRTYNRATVNGNATSTTVTDEKNNQTVYKFTIASGLFYETHRQAYQGSTGGTLLLDRYTCYNKATANCDGQAVTPPMTEADVTTSFNGGTQDLVKNGYDTSGNLLSSAHYSGSTLLQTTQNSYNSLSELTSTTQRDGSNNAYTYSYFGYDETTPTSTSGLPQHIDGFGSSGNQTSAHTSAGATYLTTTTAYNDTGMPVSTTAADEGVTRYSYDSTGTFVTTTTLPTPSSTVAMSTTSNYDATSGAALSASGPNSGQSTTFNTYDSLLRPTQATLPNGGVLNFNYQGANYKNVTEALGTGSTASQELLLDSYGRVSRQTLYNGISDGNHNWYQNDTCYDSTGLVSFVPTRYAGSGLAGANASIRCSGSGTTYGYDALGRVTSIKTDDGTAKTQYQNRAVETTDVNGVQRITQYDLLGRVSGVCEISSSTLAGVAPQSCGMDIAGTGFVTTYVYSMGSNQVNITQGSQSRVFTVDPSGRTTSVTEPERGATSYSYSYNNVGLQVVRARPQANQTNAGTLTHTTTQYDTLGRVVSIGYDDNLTPNKNYYYDQAGAGLGWSQTPTNPKGMLVATTSGSGANLARTQFSYDPMGNITSVLQCAPSICGGSNQASRGAEQAGYDLAGHLISSYDGASGSISYGRSPAGELTSMTQNTYTDQYNTPNLVSGVGNSPFGPVSYTLGNSLGTAKTYDSLGRNNGVWVCNGSTSPYCNNATQLYGNTTSFSGIRATSMCDTTLNQCQSQGYDEFNRLTVVSGGNSSNTYSYDQYGNRLSQTSSPSGYAPIYGFSNNQINGLPYDAAGNLMSDGMSHSFRYDAEGNVISVDNGSTATYVYDALNRRVSSKTSSGTTEYVYNAQGQRTSSWLVNGSAAGFGNEGRIYWDGQQFAYRAQDGTTYFQHKSPLGTDRVRTNYQGVAIDERSLAFGDAFSSDSSNAQGAAQDNDQYAGLEHDAESFSEHATFRQYSSTQGRWMSPDPYDGSYDPTNPQSLNRYSYVLNNPFSYTDPLGLYSVLCYEDVFDVDGVYAGTNQVCELLDDGGGGGGGGGGGSIGGGGGGGGSLPIGPAVVAPNKACSAALATANKNQSAIARANNALAVLQSAAGAHNIPFALLAAIGVRETGFMNVPQMGGGPGMGIFQLTVGPGMSAAQASNLNFSANYAAGMLSSNMSYLSGSFPALTSSQLLQATAASFNIGPGGISGNPNTIDVGTTGGNYGSNVVNLMNCF